MTEKPYVPNAIVRGLAFLLRHAEHNPIDWRWWDYGLFTCECELACVICAQGYGVDAVYNVWWEVYTTRAKKSATAILDLDRAALETGYDLLISKLSHSTGDDLIDQTISDVENGIIEIGVGNMTRGAWLRAAAKVAFQKQVSGLDKKCKTYCKAQKKVGAGVNIGL